MRLARVAAIDDFVARARRRTPGFAFDFIEGGAGDGAGVARNRNALASIGLLPRYLTGLAPARVDTAVNLLGRRWPWPLGIAPTGMNGLFRPRADAMIATAARALDIAIVNSTTASASMEAMAGWAGAERLWFQLYPFTDESVTADIVRRAEAAGIDTFVVTIDIPAPGIRNRDVRNGFGAAPGMDLRKLLQILACPAWLLATLRHGGPRLGNILPYASDATMVSTLRAASRLIKLDSDWDDIRRLRDRWQGRLVLKGVMDPADAERALAIGADAIWVSNHGGRQLESAPASIDCLSGIAAAVSGRAAILFDGGVRSGQDVVKACALGADMVFVGRAPLYGAMAAGETGVRHALGLILDDVQRTLVQIGAPSIAAVNCGWLR